MIESERSAAAVEAAATASLLRRAPILAATPALCAILIATFHWACSVGLASACLALVVVAISLASGIGAALCRRRAGLPAERVRRLARGSALTIGIGLGGLSALDLAAADSFSRVVIALLVALSFISAAATAPAVDLSPFLILPVFAASATILVLVAQPATLILAALLAVAAIAGLLAGRFLSKRSMEDLARLEQVDRQSALIDLLLDDRISGFRGWLWHTNGDGRLYDVAQMAAATALPAPLLEGAALEAILFAGTTRSTMGEAARSIDTAMAAKAAFGSLDLPVQIDGRSAWWRLGGKPMVDHLGVFQGYLGVGADITAEKLAEARLERITTYDDLTALANRDHFKELAVRKSAAGAETGVFGTLLYIDFDIFAQINDGLGQSAAPVLLKQVADRLRTVTPKDAILARVGGDEFAIFYAPAQASHAETLADTIISLIKPPFDLEGTRVGLHARIGIASAQEPAVDVETLFDKAALAFDYAGSRDKSFAVVFTSAMETSLQARRRYEEDLKLALVRGEFELHYQPLLNLVDGSIVGFEALLRWDHAETGMVPPAEFIPIAENAGLIVAIGQWVLAAACREAVTWDGAPVVAVNISPQHVRSPDFIRDVLAALRTSGLPPTRLEIEITEGVFLDNSDAAANNLRAIRERGVRVALDDFGTGFSSLNYLINFPVDKIKIDRSFIKDYLERKENRAIVDAMLALARKLSIRVTAEGVETLDQALALKLRRCDDIQGYLISRPVPARQIGALLATLQDDLQASIPALFETRLAAVLLMKNRR